MIYVTGDTHGYVDFAKLKIFAEENAELSKKDYVIIAGDFGGVWNKRTLDRDLKPFCDLPFSVLFVDGNHENFDLLESFPVEKWNGGKVHFIKPDIIHLMRGQIYTIENKTFFTFGGATSIDKAYRVEGYSWWRREAPDFDDMGEGIDNLRRVKNKVDYIITHSCDEAALYYPPLNSRTFQRAIYPENMMLSEFEKIIDYRHWYFGHYHMDGNLNNKKTVLYNTVVKID